MDGKTEMEPAQSRPDEGERTRRRFLTGVSTTVALGAAGTASAQSGDGQADEQGSGGGVVLTGVALALTAVTLGGVYLFSWRESPEPSFRPESEPERTPPNAHTGPMYEADVAPSETESVAHDAFDPMGTATYIALYFAVIALAWLFMYFVEFLGNGPTVVG